MRVAHASPTHTPLPARSHREARRASCRRSHARTLPAHSVSGHSRRCSWPRPAITSRLASLSYYDGAESSELTHRRTKLRFWCWCINSRTPCLARSSGTAGREHRCPMVRAVAARPWLSPWPSSRSFSGGGVRVRSSGRCCNGWLWMWDPRRLLRASRWPPYTLARFALHDADAEARRGVVADFFAESIVVHRRSACA